MRYVLCASPAITAGAVALGNGLLAATYAPSGPRGAGYQIGLGSFGAASAALALLVAYGSGPKRVRSRLIAGFGLPPVGMMLVAINPHRTRGWLIEADLVFAMWPWLVLVGGIQLVSALVAVHTLPCDGSDDAGAAGAGGGQTRLAGWYELCVKLRGLDWLKSVSLGGVLVAALAVSTVAVVVGVGMSNPSTLLLLPLWWLVLGHPVARAILSGLCGNSAVSLLLPPSDWRTSTVEVSGVVGTRKITLEGVEFDDWGSVWLVSGRSGRYRLAIPKSALTAHDRAAVRQRLGIELDGPEGYRG